MRIDIPNPCTEKYDNMSPSDLGRLCKVCNTEVVDFTNWEIKDIVGYIQKSNQKVCGRLNSYTPQIKENKRKNWLKYAAAVLTFGSLGMFSYAKTSAEPIYSEILYNHTDSVTIQIVDNQQNPLEGIILINKTKNQKFLSDKNGNVKLPIVNNDAYLIDQIGYIKQELTIQKKNVNNILKIVLEEKSTTIGEVVVEPVERIKSTFNKEIDSYRIIQQRHINSNKSFSLKIKRLFNIFSIKDED